VKLAVEVLEEARETRYFTVRFNGENHFFQVEVSGNLLLSVSFSQDWNHHRQITLTNCELQAINALLAQLAHKNIYLNPPKEVED